MTDLRYSTGTELFEFLYAKCREDHDLLAMIVDECYGSEILESLGVEVTETPEV